MNILYPEDRKAFLSGSTYHWGSLFGSSEALALIEFAKTQHQVVLYVAKDIKHYVQIQQQHIAFLSRYQRMESYFDEHNL